MNPDNPKNLGKWLAFEALGYNVQDGSMREIAAQEMISKIRDRLSLTPAIQNKISPYGIRFEVQIPIQGINGQTGTLITIWQFDNNSDVPRLITNWLEVHE